MTKSTDRVDVRSTLNYTKDTGVQPEIYYHESDAAKHARMPGDNLREIEIHDGWSRAPTFSLEREGKDICIDDIAAHVRARTYKPVYA